MKLLCIEMSDVWVLNSRKVKILEYSIFCMAGTLREQSKFFFIDKSMLFL